jgi:hypothetical protein
MHGLLTPPRATSQTSAGTLSIDLTGVIQTISKQHLSGIGKDIASFDNGTGNYNADSKKHTEKTPYRDVMSTICQRAKHIDGIE